MMKSKKTRKQFRFLDKTSRRDIEYKCQQYSEKVELFRNAKKKTKDKPHTYFMWR